MKQVLQSLRDGTIELLDVPAPRVGAGRLLIHTTTTLVSAGTERMLLEFGKAGWLDKARQQPDKVRDVLDKVRTDGLMPTLEAVRSKLDQPLALGYCNVGRVAAVGEGVAGFSIGDRVVSNGPHAEVVSVGRNLCARIPEGVSDDAAAFTVLASIGLQGIRLAEPTLGEAVVVFGLGPIGLLTVQMLLAQGCRVLGIDPDLARIELAQRHGAETLHFDGNRSPEEAAVTFSRGKGVDAAIITASTKSSDPIRQAARMCRKRGRIVLVGVTGLDLSRGDFYEKELTFQVSCSYGPGRYDPAYEELGQDYPYGLVRWTEQRNFEAVLDLMASGALDAAPLISHRFPLGQAGDAYAVLASGTPSLGILLTYPAAHADQSRRLEQRTVSLARSLEGSDPKGRVRVAFLGAGNYAGRVLIPAFRRAGADLYAVASGGGISAVHHGRKNGFSRATTDWRSLVEDPGVDVVVVATRHDLHAPQTVAAINAGKHVFCEKPLCLTLAELGEIEDAYCQASGPDTSVVDREISVGIERCDSPGRRPYLMVGFNRRFAPHVVTIKALLDTVDEPKSFVMTVNAGAIPAGHWTQIEESGGGRIIGEACHFIDLLRHLAGSPIVRFHALALGRHPSLDVRQDKASILLQFADGSVGAIHYLANGHKSFPKERLEVFCAGRVMQLDNFRRLRGWGWKRLSGLTFQRGQQKGQAECAAAFVQAVQSGRQDPICPQEIFEVSRVTIEVAAALDAASS